MESLSTSLILLILALVLLWLAATDRLSRVLDAYDVLTGKSTSTATNVSNAVSSASSALTAPLTQTALHLPSLPDNGQMLHVAAV